MSAKEKDSRQLLLGEYRNLIHSVKRSRLAADEIQIEKTEDEGDLATLHQNKELLYDLHENDFRRLESIREALKAMDRGDYGECARCNEDISPKRLRAVPWARLCIRCQEQTEKEHTLSRLVPAEPDQEEMEL
jgi:DnaK suppressor protein